MLLFYIVTKQIKALIVAVDKRRNFFVIENKKRILQSSYPIVLYAESDSVIAHTNREVHYKISSNQWNIAAAGMILGRRGDILKKKGWYSPLHVAEALKSP